MPFEDQETDGATVAGYGLLASLALTVLKRIALLERPEPGVRPVSRDDTRHLELLRELLAGSARGAQLAGRHTGLQDLMGGSESLSLDAKLNMYHVVEGMVGRERYDVFVTCAQSALGKLVRDQDRRALTVEELTFVNTALPAFLERLKRGTDWVAGEHQPLGLHRALA